MQAKGNKKQILAMKYQVWTSAFLQIFVSFGVFSLLKKLFGRGPYSCKNECKRLAVNTPVYSPSGCLQTHYKELYLPRSLSD